MKRIPSGDPLASVSPGQPVQLTASTWNALMQMLRERGFNGPQRTGGGPRRSPTETPAEVLIQNSTGDTIPEFGVLQAAGIAIEPADNEPVWRGRRILDGTLPQATKPFVVAQEPIPAGIVGRAVILGVTPAILNVVDEGHAYCGPTNDETAELTTSTGGPARILWKETGTGTGKKAVVLLFASPNSQRIRIPTCIAFRVAGS